MAKGEGSTGGATVENDYDTFMELLKQSEVELANKIMDLINEVNSLKKRLQ